MLNVPDGCCIQQLIYTYAYNMFDAIGSRTDVPPKKFVAIDLVVRRCARSKMSVATDKIALESNVTQLTTYSTFRRRCNHARSSSRRSSSHQAYRISESSVTPNGCRSDLVAGRSHSGAAEIRNQDQARRHRRSLSTLCVSTIGLFVLPKQWRSR